MTTTRFLGHCQICEQEQKLHKGVLVHHGYKRPGWGEIVGDCYGVAFLPYEMSCELLKEYLPKVVSQLEGQHDFLTKLTSGQVTHLIEMRRIGFGGSRFETEEFVAGVTEPYLWARTIEHRISEVRYSIRQLEAEVSRIQRRITEWKLMPIRTIEEEQAAKRAAKVVRDAEREAKRQEKAAIEAAKKAKREALEAKRAAIIKDFADKFNAFAMNPDANRLAARELATQTNLKKNSWFYVRELKCDEALIALGLAKRETDNWVRYYF